MLQVLTLLPSQARTADTVSAVQELADGVRDLAVWVNVTALGGTAPTLTVTIEDSPDGQQWATLLSFTAITSVLTSVMRASQLGRYIRARGVLGGTTPSVTYSVVAVAR